MTENLVWCTPKEGIEVLQSVASLWDGGKKVYVREAAGITTASIHVTVTVFVTLHYVLVILYSSFCIDTDDEVPSESDDKSESDTHIKVPSPRPLTDRGMKSPIQAHLMPTKVLCILIYLYSVAYSNVSLKQLRG